MQSVAQAWLVLHLTDSGVALGIVVGLQFLPMLLLGPFGGLVADRANKRNLLFLTQSAGGLLALVLGILVVTDTVVLWQVYLLAGLLGVVNLFDNPARQTFMIEMVGRDDLANAVSLNPSLMNMSRVVGPAIGGVIITVFGLGVCFFVNAASYVAVIIGLAMMRTANCTATTPVPRARGQVREGFRYVWRTPALRNVLLCRGTHRDLRLQLHGHPGPAGQGDLPRRCRDLRRADVVHGCRRGASAGWSPPTTPDPRPGCSRCWRWSSAVCSPRWRWRPPCWPRRAHRADGRGVDRLHRHGQRHAAADGGTGHAGPGDGALRHGLPRHDAHRGAARRRHRPVDQPPGRPAGRRGRHRAVGRAADVAPPGPAAGTTG